MIMSSSPMSVEAESQPIDADTNQVACHALTSQAPDQATAGRTGVGSQVSALTWRDLVALFASDAAGSEFMDQPGASYLLAAPSRDGTDLLLGLYGAAR